MIEYKCEKGNVTLKMEGSGVELTADALLFCIVVYEKFKQCSQKAADRFVNDLGNIRELIDGYEESELATSTMTDEELEQAAKEEEDKIDKLFDKLNELTELADKLGIK